MARRKAIKRQFGRLPSPPDPRDYKLAAYEKHLKLEGSRAWPFLSEPLDQGSTPHCVGFGGADFGINLPIQDAYTNDDGHAFYYKCKVVDGEPGAENGSYVRSIAKVLQAEGRITNYAFAANTDEITTWLLTQGPLIVGIQWMNGMFNPDAKNIIHPTGGIAGGHCVVLNEKTEDNLYHIQNSWDGWGVNGGAYISIADFGKLFAIDGEAMAAVENPLGPPPEPDNPGCLAAIKKFFGFA